MPTSVGYHDLAILLAHRSSSPSRRHEHLIASPFGTIEPAAFRYGIHPIGTAIPRPPAIVLINFDRGALGAEAWSEVAPVEPRRAARIVYPTVNRARKGNRLPFAVPAAAPINPASLPQLQRIDAAPAARLRPPAPVPAAPATAPAPAAKPQSTHAQAPLGFPAGIPAAGEIDAAAGEPSTADPPGLADEAPHDGRAEIFFGAGAVGSAGALQRWAPGAAPIAANDGDRSGNTLAALDTPVRDGGATIVGKDDLSRMKSPAQRLGLAGKARAKAERCLAQAVYFEARGEPLRGEEAVAQVVMNRVFSGYYPTNVCGVVFQNASHYLGCQFTFACEHKNLNRIDEPDMWAQARRIARETLDGKIWLADIGHATHYHAYWVHPSWVHEMTRLYKLGEHTFYRPRAWGKGNYEPVWGQRPKASDADSADDQAAKGPEAEAAPGSNHATARL